MARTWLAQGQPERTRQVLRPLLAAAERVPWVPAQAAALTLDARAAQALGDPGAPDQLAAATALARRHGLADRPDAPLAV